MAKIRVPNLGALLTGESGEESATGDFDYNEYEVTEDQARRWDAMTDKERLTLALKADREQRELREYL